ncbi:MAG: hypothetical protein J5742_03310 [Alphaproteobacteria bacterium]|nr:hypothetical protein [Alphaproteobacteria bacterium]
MKNSLELEKDDFTFRIAETLRDAHYVKIVPPLKTIRATWRNEAPYTKEITESVIQRSKLFIRTCSNTDLDFLRDLAKWIAKYLAVYTQQDSKYDDVRDPETNAAWYAAQKDLKLVLFDDFDYIKLLQQKLTEKREKKAATKAGYRKRKKAAESLGAGFVCRATPDGQTFVRRTTNKKGKQILDSDPHEVKRAFADFAKKRTGLFEDFAKKNSR